MVTLDGTGNASYSTSALTAGSHTIKAAYSGDANYGASSVSLTEIVVGPAASIAVVSGPGQTGTYGAAFADPLAVLVKDANGNAVSGASVTFSGTGLSFSSNSATTGSNGEAAVTATATASGSLTATASTSGVAGTAAFSLTATKVPLTITANNASVAYNQPIPSFTYTATGFVNGDTSAVLSGTPSETTSATQGSAAGTYPITIAQGTLTAANYTFTFINGTLTITSLGTVATPTFSLAGGTYTSTQTVTIADTTPGATIYYTTNGTTPTTSSTKYTGPIAVSSSETIEALAVANGYTTSAVASAVYTVNIPAPTVGVVSGSGQSAAYGSAFSAPLVVLIKDSSNNPVSGVVVTFSGTGVKLSAGSATTGSNGEASVTATAIATGSLTVAATASGTTGMASFTLTANPVALTVSATSVSVAYGQPIPALTYTITGFVNGDTSGIVTGVPTETTTATQTSAVGNYPITIAAGTLAATNYTFPTSNFVNGTLTLTSLGTVATPTFTPNAGTYTSAQSVTISDSTAGSVIYYTTNGTSPTTASTKYTTSLAVSGTETIEAIAVAPGYSNSAAASALYTINLPPATFTLGVSSSSASINSSQAATFTLSVTPQNGFSQTVSFTCSGLPAGDACSFSPSSVTPKGAAVNSTMTIAPTSAAKDSGLPLWEKGGAALALAMLFWPVGRRRFSHRLAVLILLMAGAIIAGCGGGPRSQNYTVTIAASGGGVSQTSSVSLTVTQ